MEERFQNLTAVQIDALPEACGYIQAGIVRQVEKHTIMYLHADRNGNQYEPNIAIFSYGVKVQPIDSLDPFSFNLVKQAGIYICIRGIKFGSDGRPKSFLVETYRPKKPELVTAAHTGAAGHNAVRRIAPQLRLVK